MAAHNELGKWGEQVAADYLTGKGWRILHRDWKYMHKDIDLICIDKDSTIVFVEVKTRSTTLLGNPEDAIDLRKKSNLIEAANAFLHQNRLFNAKWRYDSISIVGTPDIHHSITHTEKIIDIIDLQQLSKQKRHNKKDNGKWGFCRWQRW